MVINILFAVAGLACILYYLALGFAIRFFQSLDFMWLILAFLFLLRHVLVARIHKGLPPLFPGWFTTVVHSGLAVFAVSFIIIECIIFSCCFQTAPANLDYIIVLGAKVNGTQPGGALRNRIQVAYEYHEENPDTIIIASGGKGDDEGISEAQCIYNGLVAKGVPSELIIKEEESTSTYENLRNSMEFVSFDGVPKIGLVTNNFHVYRSLKLARGRGGADFYGIHVWTSYLSFPHYMLREYFGVLWGLFTGSW